MAGIQSEQQAVLIGLKMDIPSPASKGGFEGGARRVS